MARQIPGVLRGTYRLQRRLDMQTKLHKTSWCCERLLCGAEIPSWCRTVNLMIPDQRGSDASAGADVSSRLGQWDGNSWRTDAASFGMDPLTFFPVGDVGLAERQKTLPKAVCATCAVRHHCLEFAVRTIQDDGIWGGLTEDERCLLKRNERLRFANWDEAKWNQSADYVVSVHEAGLPSEST
jgi:WhiB family transcriptional regulator, redox-sensing transcriptional regulator